MKKSCITSGLLVMAFFTVGPVFTGTAQKLDPSRVPAAVKAAFAKKYPDVDRVKWEKEGNAFEAGFKDNDHVMSALFAADGALTESELTIPASSLPAPVLEYVKAHYKGIAIKEAAKITKATGEINYEAEVKGMDLIFD
ncbi:MAG: PepSY-like domain-containing protein, partial [Bacteroidota bacterium]